MHQQLQRHDPQAILVSFRPGDGVPKQIMAHCAQLRGVQDTIILCNTIQERFYWKEQGFFSETFRSLAYKWHLDLRICPENIHSSDTILPAFISFLKSQDSSRFLSALRHVAVIDGQDLSRCEAEVVHLLSQGIPDKSSECVHSLLGVLPLDMVGLVQKYLSS